MPALALPRRRNLKSRCVIRVPVQLVYTHWSSVMCNNLSRYQPEPYKSNRNMAIGTNKNKSMCYNGERTLTLLLIAAYHGSRLFIAVFARS